jgi:HEAT repeat protein
MEALLGADAGLGAIVVTLLAGLATMRALARRRGRLVADARERFEDLVAEQLVADGAVVAPRGLDRLERRVLLDVGLAALVELRGRERDRVAALLEAAGLVDPEAAKLRRGRPGARRRAGDVLGQIASPGTREPLRAALEDPDALVRLAAARGLAELGDSEVASVMSAIADVAAEHQAGAVAELVLTLGTRAPGSLGALYATSGSPAVRRLVVATIGELRLGAHVALLRAALTEEDELAARAARGLGLIGDVEATPDLLALLADPQRSWFVRAAATTALGRLGDPAAVAPLAAELAESDEWPRRRAAAEALAQLGPSGESALRAALAGPSPEAHEHAAAALDR